MRSSLDEMIDPFVICSSVRGADGAIVDFRVDFANRAAGEFIGRAPETLMGAVLPERMMRLRDRWFFDVVREVVDSVPAGRKKVPQRDHIADVDKRVDRGQCISAQGSAGHGLNGRPVLAGLRAEGAVGFPPSLDVRVFGEVLEIEAVADLLLGVAQKQYKLFRRGTVGDIVGDDHPA
jgi:hypothetical protein